MLGRVVVEVVKAVLLAVIHALVAEWVGDQDDIGLFDTDGAIHAGVFKNDTRFFITADDDVFRLFIPGGVRFHAELRAE